jgi:uncharacterized protein (DUF697 family)
MSWMSDRLRRTILAGLRRAYARVRVDPDEYLVRLRTAHGLGIQSYEDMFSVELEVLDSLADRTISAARKVAALEGAGLGMGGMLTLLPDMSILSAIVIRMLQKLSLIYGFTYSTDEEVAALWLAAATAAGLDLGREVVEKEALERFVPRVMERIAAKMSAEVAEKWSARLIPVLSGALGGALNYYFIRQWGRRAKQYFREKHRQARSGRLLTVTPELSERATSFSQSRGSSERSRL